jgi:homoserine kinase
VRVRVLAPATSANLGPGFDALGLALALHNEVSASEFDRVVVRVEGEGSGVLSTGEDNVVVRGVRLAYQEAGRSFKGIAIECVNRIPLARGLGSSAAAWVGGLVAGNGLLGSTLTPGLMLGLAARAEGHPDNVTAALLGGLTVSCEAADGAVEAITLGVPASLRWVLLIPELTSETREARAVLPASVPREDAVFNVQRVALLLAGLQADRPGALAAALEDRLHQPYRLKLFPWMPAVVEAARAAGALGCVLSGAGPALLAVVNGEPAPIARAMETALGAAGLRGKACVLDVDTRGALGRVEIDP